MVLQTPLPEFCNQTSHPAHSPLGQGARPLPVNKSDCSGKNTAATSWPPAPGTAGPHSSSTGLRRGHRRGRQAQGPAAGSPLLSGPDLEGQQEENGEFASWAQPSTAQGWRRLEDWLRHITVGDRGRARKPCSAPHAPYLGKQVQPLSHPAWRDPHLQVSRCSPPRPERVETRQVPHLRAGTAQPPLG